MGALITSQLIMIIMDQYLVIWDTLSSWMPNMKNKIEGCRDTNYTVRGHILDKLVDTNGYNSGNVPDKAISTNLHFLVISGSFLIPHHCITLNFVFVYE